MSELGDRLTELRQDNQEKQRDIARLLHISSGSVSNYETGAHLPTVETLRTLAEHFEVTTDYLLGRTNSRVSAETLNKPFAEDISFGVLLERLSELPMEKRTLLLALIEDMQISSYVKNHRGNP